MNTHTEVVEDNGGEFAGCLETRCKQLDSLLMERGEGICPLEAIHDQVGPVELRGVEGASAVDGCTESLGGMEAPGTLVVTRFPSVVVPVCVVSRCVYTSVTKCVLQRAHSVDARACVRATACVTETPCVDETPCITETPSMEETPCVSGVVASVAKCVLPSTPCEEEAPRVKEAVCVSETVCMKETPRVSVPACVSSRVCVSERVCVRETACVRSLYVREMTVGMREHAATSPSGRVMVRCMSLVTRGSLSAWIEWRRRRRQRDKGRVAAVAVLRTALGLHGDEREVRAVQRMRPPCACLRE